MRDEKTPAAWNLPLGEAALAELRQSVQRGRPFGDGPWVKGTARRLALEFTLRGPGRPRKSSAEEKNQ